MTVKEIAAMAGVSPATVSLVLNVKKVESSFQWSFNIAANIFSYSPFFTPPRTINCSGENVSPKMDKRSFKTFYPHYAGDPFNFAAHFRIFCPVLHAP